MTVECSLFSGRTIAALTSVSVRLNGVTNPSPSGARTLAVSTTADIDAVNAPFNVAAAGSLTNVTATNASPSAAAGARTSYVLAFTVSATGGLSQQANSRLDVSFPAGTSFPGWTGGTITVDGTNVGSCSGPVGLNVTCALYSGRTISRRRQRHRHPRRRHQRHRRHRQDPHRLHHQRPRRHQLRPLRRHCRRHPHQRHRHQRQPLRRRRGADQLRPRLHRLRHRRPEPGSQQPPRRQLPRRHQLPRLDRRHHHRRRHQRRQLLRPRRPQRHLRPLQRPHHRAGANVTVTLDGVTNATAGTGKILTASTTSDPAVTNSAPFDVAAAGTLTNVTATNASPSAAAGARTSYVLAFTVSATGGLSQEANSRLDVSFPAGTSFPGWTGGTITVDGTNVGSCSGPVGLNVTCALFSGRTISSGANVTVTLDGVTNATAGTGKILTASTTSDPAVTNSAPFDVRAAGTLTNVTAAVSSLTPSARTRYVVRFTTSATGGLSQQANSRLDVSVPRRHHLPGLDRRHRPRRRDRARRRELQYPDRPRRPVRALLRARRRRRARPADHVRQHHQSADHRPAATPGLDDFRPGGDHLVELHAG